MLQDAEIDLKDTSKHAPNAFLLALIPFLQKIGVLTFLSIVEIPMKEVTHTIKTKMMTLLLSYLIGCRTVNQVNLALRYELLACQSLEIDSFPDNSGISRFLARIDSYAVSDIQSVSQVLLEAHGLAQNLTGIVLVDLDSTGLVVTGDQFELADARFCQKPWCDRLSIKFSHC